MEEIIKKAIEGGWRPTYLSLPHLRKHSCDYEVVCDPLFWQALGKSCGWTCCGVYNGTGVRPKGCESCDDPVIRKALQFHEINLTQGWDKAVEYLQDLIK